MCVRACIRAWVIVCVSEGERVERVRERERERRPIEWAIKVWQAQKKRYEILFKRNSS